MEYLDAKYSWDAPSLFSNKFDVLNSKIYNDTTDFIGPSSSVKLLDDNSGVRFTGDDAFLSLGEYSVSFSFELKKVFIFVICVCH